MRSFSSSMLLFRSMCCMVVCGSAWSAESVQLLTVCGTAWSTEAVEHCCLWYGLVSWGCATLLTVCGATWSAEAVQLLTVCGTAWSTEAVEHCWLSVVRPGQLRLCNTADWHQHLNFHYRAATGSSTRERIFCVIGLNVGKDSEL